MNLSSMKSEHLTAVVSTAVAIALLGAAVTADHSITSSQDEIAQLESDLRFQLDRAKRFNSEKAAVCTAQLDQALKAWHQAEPSETNRSQLAKWLRESMVRSMPGSEMQLPRPPQFVSSPPIDTSLPADDLDFPAEIDLAVENSQPEPQSSTTAPVSELPDPVGQKPTLADYFQPPAPQTSPAVPLARESSTRESIAIAQAHVFPQRTTPSRTAVATASASINLSELTARTAGYHDGLEEIEATLISSSSPDISQLATQVGRLDSLARNYRFVSLYYNSLSDQERRQVLAPRPISSTIAKLRRQLDRSIDGVKVFQLRQQLELIASSTK